MVLCKPSLMLIFGLKPVNSSILELSHHNLNTSDLPGLIRSLSTINSTSLFINSLIKFRVSPILISKLDPILTVCPIDSSHSARSINPRHVSST